MVNYPNLFSEIEIASRRLQNRICLCATVTNFARANKITDEWRNFLIERARGGAGANVGSRNRRQPTSCGASNETAHARQSECVTG